MMVGGVAECTVEAGMLFYLAISLVLCVDMANGNWPAEFLEGLPQGGLASDYSCPLRHTTEGGMN